MIPVTVVIPVYNGEQYLRETIESVVNQTEPPSEIIVVIDGSLDNSVNIAKQYPVKIIMQDNRGICAARNTGIVNAKNEWVALLDQDDLWDKNKLHQQWQLLGNYNDIDLIFTDVIFSVDGLLEKKTRLSSINRHASTIKKHLQNNCYLYDSRSLCEQIKFANYLTPSTLLARTKSIRRSGLFDEELERCEDREFFLRIFPSTKVAIIEYPLVTYRVHQSNASNNNKKMLYGSICMAEKILNNPDKYYKEIVDYFAVLLPDMYYRYAVTILSDYDTINARKYFEKSYRINCSYKSALGFFVTFFGQSLIKKIFMWRSPI